MGDRMSMDQRESEGRSVEKALAAAKEQRLQRQDPIRTLIGTLQEMKAREAKDFDEVIAYLRSFAERKRGDLEYFERLLGIRA